MSNIWHDYRNFKIAINKTYESTEDRIARGSVDAAVVGYYFYIWQRPEQGQGLRQVLTTVDYPTETEAVAKAQEAIDTIINSYPKLPAELLVDTRWADTKWDRLDD